MHVNLFEESKVEKTAKETCSSVMEKESLTNSTIESQNQNGHNHRKRFQFFHCCIKRVLSYGKNWQGSQK